MKHLCPTSLFIGCVACLGAFTLTVNAEPNEPSPARVEEANESVKPSGGNDRAQNSAPLAVDDHAIIKRLETEGGRLLREGKLTDGNSLRQQLQALQKKPAGQAVQGLLPAPADAPAVKDLYTATRHGTLILAGVRKGEKAEDTSVDTACGFVVTAQGVAVTNYHVVAYATNNGMIAMTGDGRIAGVKSVLAASEEYDVAIIQLDGDGFTPFPVAPAAAVGEKVAVLSHPDRKFYCLNQGMVTRYSVASGEEGVLPVAAMEISADFGRGSSGGPIFNLAGQVVGMVNHTQSVYYNDDGKGNMLNLQMVFKRCVLSEQILRILSGKPAQAVGKTLLP